MRGGSKKRINVCNKMTDACAKTLKVGIIIMAVCCLSVSSYAVTSATSRTKKQLESLRIALQEDKTSREAEKKLWKLASFTKRKKHDTKFTIGCAALTILARNARNAIGYEISRNKKSMLSDSADTSMTAIEKNEFVKVLKYLRKFDKYSDISNFEYLKNSHDKYTNPQLAVFLELAYSKAILSRNIKEPGNSELKNSLKMLTYAEARTEGLDKAETLCQWGELLRELKEYTRSETYLKNALAYGEKWFQSEKASETGKTKQQPGTAEWLKIRKRIKDLLFLLSFDLLEEKYGKAYALYVKIRTFCDNEDWWLAFPLAVELKTKYPDTVYGEYAKLAWCKMLLGNDKAEEMGDSSLPSGVKELEKFITEKSHGLYRGEALMALGKFYLEYKWDSKLSSKYYKQALNWFREVRKRKDIIDLYTVPPEVTAISAQQGKISFLNEWRLTEYRKPKPKEIINRKTASWYISENEKDALFMVGFFFFMEGKYDMAEKYFEQVKNIDSDIAKLVGLSWPNIYWRLISACHVKRMLFPAENKKYLKGRNKLRVALAELNYICERFSQAKQLYLEMLEDPSISKNEKAIAYIGIAVCMDMLPEMTSEDKKKAVDLLKKAAELGKKSSISGTAYVKLGYMYLTVSWKGRRKNALHCFEQYLAKCPNGAFSKDAQFKQIKLYLDMGKPAKAELLFSKYKFQEKYPSSGYTIALTRRFRELKN